MRLGSLNYVITQLIDFLVPLKNSISSLKSQEWLKSFCCHPIVVVILSDSLQSQNEKMNKALVK